MNIRRIVLATAVVIVSSLALSGGQLGSAYAALKSCSVTQKTSYFDLMDTKSTIYSNISSWNREVKILESRNSDLTATGNQNSAEFLNNSSQIKNLKSKISSANSSLTKIGASIEAITKKCSVAAVSSGVNGAKCSSTDKASINSLLYDIAKIQQKIQSDYLNSYNMNKAANQGQATTDDVNRLYGILRATQEKEALYISKVEILIASCPNDGYVPPKRFDLSTINPSIHKYQYLEDISLFSNMRIGGTKILFADQEMSVDCEGGWDGKHPTYGENFKIKNAKFFAVPSTGQGSYYYFPSMSNGQNLPSKLNIKTEILNYNLPDWRATFWMKVIPIAPAEDFQNICGIRFTKFSNIADQIGSDVMAFGVVMDMESKYYYLGAVLVRPSPADVSLVYDKSRGQLICSVKHEAGYSPPFEGDLLELRDSQNNVIPTDGAWSERRLSFVEMQKYRGQVLTCFSSFPTPLGTSSGTVSYSVPK